MISGFGAAAVATQRVGGQIESLSWNTADGFGAALNAFVGQNYGAKKSDRIRKGYSISLRILVVWGALISAAFIFLPTPISHLFFHEAQAIRISAEYLVILGFSEIFMCVELMTVGKDHALQFDQYHADRSQNSTGHIPYRQRNGTVRYLVGPDDFIDSQGNPLFPDLQVYRTQTVMCFYLRNTPRYSILKI